MYKHFVQNEPLYKHCTYRVGGKARYLARVFDADGLLRAFELSDKRLILGKGSKVLISDEGFDGVVILMCGSCVRFSERLQLGGGFNFDSNAFGLSNPYSSFKTDDPSGLQCGIAYADAGVSLPYLSGLYVQKGFKGLEWACGIPASVGGALRLNAGAYGGDMSKIVVCADVLRDGKMVRLNNTECGFAYRHSGFYPSDVIIGAWLKPEAGDKNQIEELRLEYTAKRANAQPGGKSCGSVFKAGARPAYQYILDAGLSGLTVGGAQVSTKHANFILNKGSATARDIYTLIQAVKAEVFANQGVRLEEEVIYAGEF